jgi:2-methylcitrate dehydratase PrpD
MGMKSQNPPSPLMVELSEYLASALKRKLPAEVMERGKIHLVDSVAAIVSGMRLLPGRRAVGYVKSLGGAREAGVLGTSVVTTMMQAALANGVAGHADETDDTHPPTRSHPGCSVVPALLAVCEHHRYSGEKMMRAMVLAYDVCARLLLALDNIHLLHTGHHAGAKGGLFGCATSVGALFRFDARRMRYVLSYCAQQASGLYTMHRDTEHIEKAYGIGGMPAMNGISAALMVKNGFTGVEDVFSGKPDFFSIYNPNADREAMIRGLGHDYEIMRGGIKYWAAGGPIQAPLHVMRGLIRDHGIRAADVAHVTVRIPEKEFGIVNNREMPDINVQHLLSVMLIDGNVTFASAHDYERMADRAVLRMRAKVEAVPDATLTDPARRWRCAMEVKLKNGRTLKDATMAAKGGLDNPLTRQDEEEKAMDLMGPVLGQRRSRALIAQLLEMETLGDVRALRPLYTR